MLRLGTDAEKALERVSKAEGVSKNAAIERALIEYDSKRSGLRDKLLQQIIAEDQPLLDRLA